MILPAKKRKIIAGVAFSFIFLIVIIYIIRGKHEYTDNAYLKSDIVIIRPKVSGYITDVFVEDNQTVKDGQIIAKIDDKDYKLRLIQAQENVKIAKAKINSLTHQVHISTYEVNNSLSSKESARVSLDIANKEFKRAQVLIKDKAISQTNFDKIKDLKSKAENAFSTARSNYEASKHKLEITEIERTEAKSILKSHEAELDIAWIDFENTNIKAATRGKLSNRSLQVGQLVSVNSALAYLVQDNIWVNANFKEVQVGRMRVNQQVIVTIDSVPGKKFKAIVESLSPATGAEFSILPPENATGNFTKIVQRVPVKILFDKDQDLSMLKPGLSCEVKVMIE
ncbi:MAG: HlyD family secretion protein [Pseudomonadota bacterium]